MAVYSEISKNRKKVLSSNPKDQEDRVFPLKKQFSN